MSTPDGYLKDGQGRLIPRESVKPEHLLEDELVRKIVAKATAMSEQLKTFRDEARAEVQAYLDLLAQQYDTKRGGTRGNITLTSYDDTLRVTLAVGDTRTFGPGLHIGKGLIDEYLVDVTQDTSADLRTLVQGVFQVGKTGRLDVDSILGLRKYNIADDRWKRAMVAISDSLRIQSSKEYMRVHQRTKPDEEFRQIPLDVARV